MGREWKEGEKQQKRKERVSALSSRSGRCCVYRDGKIVRESEHRPLSIPRWFGRQLRSCQRGQEVDLAPFPRTNGRSRQLGVWAGQKVGTALQSQPLSCLHISNWHRLGSLRTLLGGRVTTDEHPSGGLRSRNCLNSNAAPHHPGLMCFGYDHVQLQCSLPPLDRKSVV